MINIVKNEEKYWEFIRLVRTHEDVKKGFIQQASIPLIDHQEYMKQHGHTYYIALKGDTPAGFIGLIGDDIRVATHPQFQGQGIAKQLVAKIIEDNPKAIAKVKMDNKASIKLFESCGFKKKFYILELE